MHLQLQSTFAPQTADGKIDESESDWIKVSEESFFKNTHTYLELILPETLESGRKYSIVIKTSAGRGKSVNKTVRKLVYERAVLVN